MKAIVITGVAGVVLLVLLVLGVTFLGRSLRTGTADSSDYALTGPECTVNDVLGPQASGRITNTSGRRQGFEVEVRFRSQADGTFISDNIAVVETLDEGESTEWKATSFKDPPADGRVGCSVTEVRYANYGD